MKVKFHRKKRDQKRALLKSLARELFLREKIKTTKAKAKALRDFAQRMIEKAKREDVEKLNKVRYLRRYFSKEVVKKLIEDIAQRYKERKGGYVKILRIGKRASDGAEIFLVKLV